MRLQGFQIGLQGPAKPRQARIVERGEGVGQNQVDNPSDKGEYMIGRLTGLLGEKTPPQILVDCGGVGYEVLVPMSTFYLLPSVGEKTTLLTHLVVREDAQILFGFLTPHERDAFRQLIKISGVGPRTALGVLSGMSVEDLSQAVAQQDAGMLVKIPGIGKKTAERLLLELKGKMLEGLSGLSSSGQAPSAEQSASDVEQALMALGYNEREARQALRNLPPGLTVSEGIKWALKALSA